MAFANFANITKVPELRRRLLFTLGMLAIYRMGVFITTPGIDRNVMRSVVQRQSGGLLGMFNMFTGGALENLSIFALGIMPYISASIIMQLLGTVYKPIEELRKEGEQGRRKLDQYTRYGTVLLSIFQSFGIAMYLEGLNNNDLGGGRFGDVVADPGWAFRFMTVVTLTTGTAFIMWVGEQITERGVSNGISLIIFAGILSDLPGVAFGYAAANEGNVQPLTVATLIGVVVLTVSVVVFFERAQRRIPIVYSRRQVGRRVYGGQTAHLGLHAGRAQQGWLDVQHLLCAADHLLLLLLHGGDRAAGRHRGQPEEAAGERAGDSAGQADGRVYRQGADAHHTWRRAVRGSGMPDSELRHECVPHRVPVRRYVDHDRGGCGARLGVEHRVAPDHAQLRGPHRAEGIADSRSAGLGARKGNER